jgi:hypothetical protein
MERNSSVASDEHDKIAWWSSNDIVDLLLADESTVR